MRKTIVIATAACMLTVTAAMANHQNQNADFNVNPTSFRTVELNTLCKAIVKGDVDLVKKLIAMGEDVNRKSLGKTPAIFAARYNRVEILKILIENGADLRIKSNKGHSITEIAELANAKEALQS